MKDNFVTQFLRFFKEDISDKSIELFEEVITYKQISKNEIIIHEADSADKFFLIKEGIVGSFSKSIDEEKEYIRAIHANNDVFTNLSSLNTGRLYKTKNNYKSLTDCTVYEGSFIKFIEFTNTSHEFAILYGRIIQRALLISQTRLDELSLLDATQRYEILKQRIANIENLIPQYQIASYLNITPVQLSRIRKSLLSK
ncbi:Crp/Fnr family transcriptional regulator [Tenacibaculum sp. M341]|uniref:Crp/Fnr family transcriptional regulator n=1 Tax=Tenacibaculum sp. M341 TaxID=2530339 RepID=UPI001049C4B5|nr:Crp/Fnr family transcriptional regulator [Tenacibaculum sp. M341]TCI84435.1 Crp/Fnr family transcriptional regulator [Tenacibaculum sp. M341]